LKKQILINAEAGEIRIALRIENRLDDYFVERTEHKAIVGNIYKGAVDSIVPAIGAAFINYGASKNGFLYVTDATETTVDFGEGEIIYEAEEKKDRGRLKIEELLKKGQQILIQAVKEELGTKGARLTTNISLPGRFLVFMPNSSKIGISRKIRDEGERKRIKDILKSFKLKEGGVIARTAASGCSEKDLIRDVRYLSKIWGRIKVAAKRKQAPALLYEELDLTSKIIRDVFTEDVDKIIIDDKFEFKKIRHAIANFAPSFKSRIELYKNDEPLFEKYGVEKEIDEIYQRKVFLKCGGYITIEQTEGMVAIDVNSGRFTKKKDPEETIYRVNSEAAVEVARQLRLRDIGGIVVTDFIDMANPHYRRNVFNSLREELKKDRAKTNIASISELDIVELTRQRTHKSMESASYQTCPYCNGRGLIKSIDTISILAIRRLKDFLKSAKGRQGAEIVVHSDVAVKLRKDENGLLYKLQRNFRAKITVLENNRFHLEDIEINPHASFKLKA